MFSLFSLLLIFIFVGSDLLLGNIIDYSSNEKGFYTNTWSDINSNDKN